MSGLEAVIDGLWSLLGVGLIHGTILAVLTWVLARTVLRGARPALMAALWTVVLLKFVVPVGPEVPLSLSGVVDGFLSADVAGESEPGFAMSAATATATERSALTTTEVLWIAGKLAALLLYLGIVVRIFRRRFATQRVLRRAAERLPAVSPAISAVVERAVHKVGLARTPDVRLSRSADSPQLIGLYRPVVIVPEHLAARPVELEATLLHEMAHLRRHDTWLRALQLVVASVFFFWPVVRWINHRIDDHREMACDQWAITYSELGPAQYARTLVALARRGRSRRTAAELSLGGIFLGAVLVRGKKQLDARVDSLLRGRARPRLSLLSGAGLAIWAMLSLGGAGGARAQVAPESGECVIEPGVLEYILATFPEADTDGDGELSRDEVCAHQKRLRELGALDRGHMSVGADASSAAALATPLDSAWLECELCSCSDESEHLPLDKKICSAEGNK